MVRVGILCSGGDCQALNAAMSGLAKAIYQKDKNVKILGFRDGYKGLIANNFKMMRQEDFSGIMVKGGTILGTSRFPYKKLYDPTEDGLDKITEMVKNYNANKLDCLVILGGNGSHKTAKILKENGLNIVTLSKTIDNDLAETEVTFGFQTAVDIATSAIDCIHTTAASHSRVFIVEIMGNKTGWLTLNAGMAGGADVILIPEIPYDIEKVIHTIKTREKNGKRFTIIAVAEGAISKDEALLGKKERKERKQAENYSSVSYKIAELINAKAGYEVRITVPGHIQRGGTPDSYDRVLAMRLGIHAAKLIQNKEFGYMVGIKGTEIIKIPLEDVAGKTKMIDPASDIIQQVKAIGISLGD